MTESNQGHGVCLDICERRDTALGVLRSKEGLFVASQSHWDMYSVPVLVGIVIPFPPLHRFRIQ